MKSCLAWKRSCQFDLTVKVNRYFQTLVEYFQQQQNKLFYCINGKMAVLILS
jgi:hypothetical protein